MFNNSLKRKDLVKYLSSKTGFSLNYSKKLIDDLINIITKEIRHGKFKLKDIGTFKLLDKNERVGRNPKTQEEFVISKRKAISFIVSEKVKDKLDKL